MGPLPPQLTRRDEEHLFNSSSSEMSLDILGRLVEPRSCRSCRTRRNHSSGPESAASLFIAAKEDYYTQANTLVLYPPRHPPTTSELPQVLLHHPSPVPHTDPASAVAMDTYFGLHAQGSIETLAHRGNTCPVDPHGASRTPKSSVLTSDTAENTTLEFYHLPILTNTEDPGQTLL